MAGSRQKSLARKKSPDMASAFSNILNCGPDNVPAGRQYPITSQKHRFGHCAAQRRSKQRFARSSEKGLGKWYWHGTSVAMRSWSVPREECAGRFLTMELMLTIK